MDFLKLKNKKILINGGLGLIGIELSKLLLEYGAFIYIIDIDKTKSKYFKNKFKKNLNKFEIHNYDTSSKSNIKKIEKFISKINKIDCYINLSYPKDSDWENNSFKNIKLKSLLSNVEKNTISYFWLTNLIAKKMSKNKSGSIILFSSIYGVVGQDLSIYKNTKIKENATYSFIKGGIINYVRLLSSYYGKYNIRVNSISPGGVEDSKSKKQESKFLTNYKLKVPLKRLAKPEEIANIAIFLSSDSSSYITGTNIIIDGGWTAI